ncbi:MAG: hypothetical protein VYC39_05005 [Myxococcota bacterium]|nr:hypothetical protein [Myxococcota bacterium]
MVSEYSEEGISGSKEVLDSELSAEELRTLVDAGDIRSIEAALREMNVRIPSVIRQIDRCLMEGQSNVATVLATMLISRFHVTQANALADQIISQAENAGADELVDLVAALMQQERLSSARKVLEKILEKVQGHDRAQYFKSLLAARAGHIEDAFQSIARCSPKLLGAHGLAQQARFAAWCRRAKAFEGAVRLAKQAEERKSYEQDDEDVSIQITAAERLQNRLTTTNIDSPSLRDALFLEYGSLLVEESVDEARFGCFDETPITYGDAGRLIRKIAEILPQFGEIQELVYATEDGEVVAAGLSQILKKPYRAWHKELNAKDGDWLCMGSAATHPHVNNKTVQSLDQALMKGTLRTLCLVLPRGWRAPIVPDVIGRMTTDDEFLWEIDDEIEDIYEEMVDDEPTAELVRNDSEKIEENMRAYPELMRAAEPLPRFPHLAYRDELPLPGGR